MAADDEALRKHFFTVLRLKTSVLQTMLFQPFIILRIFGVKSPFLAGFFVVANVIV